MGGRASPIERFGPPLCFDASRLVVMIRCLRRLLTAIYEDGRYSMQSVGPWYYDYPISKECAQWAHEDCWLSHCECECHNPASELTAV